MEKILKLMA